MYSLPQQRRSGCHATGSVLAKATKGHPHASHISVLAATYSSLRDSAQASPPCRLPGLGEARFLSAHGMLDRRLLSVNARHIKNTVSHHITCSSVKAGTVSCSILYHQHLGRYMLSHGKNDCINHQHFIYKSVCNHCIRTSREHRLLPGSCLRLGSRQHRTAGFGLGGQPEPGHGPELTSIKPALKRS